MRSNHKSLICKMIGHKYKEVSVKRGSGTSYGWLYITTSLPVPLDTKREVEAKLLELKAVGTYLDDMTCEYDTNVLWEVKHERR